MRYVTVLVLLFFSIVSAQVSARRIAGVLYVSATDVASIMGYSQSESSESLTIRTLDNVLILFSGSPDITFGGSEDTLSAPVVLQGEWFAPEDVLSFLGLGSVGNLITLSDGSTLSLEFPSVPAITSSRSAVMDLGNSVQGLAFYAPGSAGADTVSVLMVDVGLMGLAFPEQQKTFDELQQKFTSGKPIYIVVTALAEAGWESIFTIEQQGRVLEYRAPGSLTLLEGTTATVSPDKPVSAILLLPDWVNLRELVTVTWSDTTATIKFRR